MLKERVAETFGNQNPGSIVGAASLANHEKVQRYRNGIADFFRRVNSTLACRTVPMKWADYAELSYDEDKTIAFTDGESVFINSKFFQDSIENHVRGGNLLGAVGPIARMKGASYHELAHILYTPRQNTQFIKDLMEHQAMRSLQPEAGVYSDLMRSFNMLEDQRIETRFGAKYRTAVVYFSEMCAKYITQFDGTDQVARMAFPLLWGRRFMSELVPQAEKIHREYIEAHGCQCDVDSIKSVIDEFRSIVFPGDSKRALELVTQFDDYMIELFHPKTEPGDHNSFGGRENVTSDNKRWTESDKEGHSYIRKGTPTRSADQKKDAQDAEDWVEELGEPGEPGDAPETGEMGDGSDEGSPQSGGASGSDDAGSEGGENEGSEASDTSSRGDTKGSGVTTGDSGDTGGERNKLADEVAQMLSELLDAGAEYEMATRADASGDVKNINKVLNKARRQAKPDRRGSEPRDVTSMMRLSSRRIQDTFTVIRSEGEDIWQTGQSSGRLNTRDVMNARGLSFDVFDEWIDLGDEATSFEVVILVDQSSSMNGFEMRSVSSALWIIRHACIAMDIPVTAIGYDCTARLLYSPSCPISHTKWDDLKSNGSTDPDDAIEWAISIFNTSQATHKLLFSLTDGEWSWTNTTKALMDRVRNLGVHSTLILQGAWRGYYEDGQYDPHEMLNNRSKKVRFTFPEVEPKTGNYGHDRQVKVGDSQRDLPEVVTKSMEKLAVASIMSV